MNSLNWHAYLHRLRIHRKTAVHGFQTLGNQPAIPQSRPRGFRGQVRPVERKDDRLADATSSCVRRRVGTCGLTLPGECRLKLRRTSSARYGDADILSTQA